VPITHYATPLSLHDALPIFTVLENVSFGLRHLGRQERRTEALAMLDVVHLQDCAARFPHELSGGQQQRVALARALVTRPRLILRSEEHTSELQSRENLVCRL